MAGFEPTVHPTGQQPGSARLWGRTDTCQKLSGEEKTIPAPCEQNLGLEGPALPGLPQLACWSWGKKAKAKSASN